MARLRFTTIVALFALISCSALAQAASGSSTLLSGYGGPGQGNQAILGSTLIGGAGGSGGGGAASGGGEGPAEQASTLEAAGTATGAGGAAGRGRGHGQAQRHASGKAPATAGAETIGRVLDTERASASTLGLSGSDWSYVVLAFLVLALTAFGTVVLARRTGRAAQGRTAGER
jgi:hypothetical protein